MVLIIRTTNSSRLSFFILIDGFLITLYYKETGNKAILKQLSLHKLRHRKDRDYQFWQEGVHPQRVQDREMMCQKIEYIHNNPIRRGYIEDPEHWRYSSARNYSGGSGVLEVCKEW